MSNEQVAMSNERKQSKLDELIQQYCPDGVPNKTLGELGKFFGGLTGKSKDDFTDGNAKFITYKNVYTNPALQIDVEDRVKIADGEKQRIGIARAFLHNAPIILLDEPTSNLDSLNEAMILKSLLNVKAEKLIILVSHRQSTMAICDQVIGIENGRMS
mgnify:CR=1 FL=1